MRVEVEVMPGRDASRRLQTRWNALVADEPNTLSGLDGTNTMEWFDSILEAFPEAEAARVIVAREGDELLGVLPVIAGTRGKLGDRLLVATERYGGRNGILFKPHREDVPRALLDGLGRVWPDWVSLQMTLVSGSENARAVSDLCSKLSYSILCGAEQESPFFPLLESRESFRKHLSKGLLQNLRTARNKSGTLGPIAFRKFQLAADAEELLQIVLTVDRLSWKHEAGTAISVLPRQENFYKAFFPRAMESGLLYAEVIFLSDQPIAYNFGLARDKVFSCLKNSFVEKFDKLSPSQLLNESMFDNLRQLGVVTYDFMGVVEPHKLQWSGLNQTYRRSVWTIFNRTAKARATALLQRRKQTLKQMLQRTSSRK